MDPSRALIAMGVALIAIGLALALVPGMGRLPGDVRLEGDGWTVYAPIATSIVVSAALTVALMVFSRIARR